MFDAGVESPLDGLLGSIRSVVAGVEVDCLEVPVAARVVEQCAEAERLLAALRVLTTATLTDKALWRREGFRSVAAWMASKTGTAVGTAQATLEMVEQLDQPPATEAAFRAGLLLEVQARQIADAASVAPEAEQQLLVAAGKLSLRGLREECRRIDPSHVHAEIGEVAAGRATGRTDDAQITLYKSVGVAVQDAAAAALILAAARARGAGIEIEL